MNITNKYIISVIVAIVASFLFLKPIVSHESEFRVVVANTSEHPITSITITGNGMEPKKIGPIRVGHIQDYYFIPAQDGTLHYSIIQGKRQSDGIIRAELKKSETGRVYVVVGELHKIRILDEYDSAY